MNGISVGCRHNYRGNSLVSHLQLLGSAAPWRTQDAAGGGCRMTEQNRTRDGTQPTSTLWNLSMRLTSPVLDRGHLIICKCAIALTEVDT